MDALRNSRLLIVGAGGLGCEALPNAALLGFGHITVIDMDTIDLSNLNRQFLFSEADIGKAKAQVACDNVRRRLSTQITLEPVVGRLQDQNDEFYLSFDVIVAGLDSVAARQWLSATLVRIAVDYGEIIPLIDGGTEGLLGQIRTIFPTQGPCYECTMDLVTPPVNFPLCTIANTPRLPEHCVEYITTVVWPKDDPFSAALDGDNPAHVRWVLDKAQERASLFRIAGITWQLAQGVIKRIVPAVASTNAVVAAGLVNEAFKIVTKLAPPLDNYMFLSSTDGIYSYTFHYEKKDDCPVCATRTESVQVPRAATLRDLLVRLERDFALHRPSLTDDASLASVFMQGAMRAAFEANLDRALGDLVPSGRLAVTDPSLPTSMTLHLDYNCI